MPFEPPTEDQVHAVLEIHEELRRRHLLVSGSKQAPLVSRRLSGGKFRLVGLGTKDSPYEVDDEDTLEGLQRRIDELHARKRALLQG